MIGQKSLIVFSTQWLGYVLLTASSVLVARILGPENVGRMAFSFGVIGILFMFTSLGFAQAHQKRLAEGEDPGLCYGTFICILGTLNVLVFCAGLFIFPLVKVQLGNARLAFILFLVYQSLTNLGQIFTNGFYGRQQFVKAAVFSISGRMARLLGVCTVLLFWPSLESLAICFIMEAGVSLAFGVGLSGVLKDIKWPTRASFNSYWKYAKPLAITSPLGILGDNLDRVTLGSRYGVETVGYYNVALNMFEALKSLPSAMVSVLFPNMASEFVRGGADALRQIFYSVQRRFLLISTPIAVLGVLWSADIVTLFFGALFRPAGPPLAIFFLLFWFVGFGNTYHYVLYATDKHHLFMWLSPLASGLYFISLTVLCRPSLALGAIGAALSIGVIPLVSFPFVLARTRRLYGIMVTRVVFSFIFAGAAMYVAAWLLSFWRGGLMFRALWSAVGLVVYAALLRAFKQFGSEDIEYLVYLANPGQLLKYLKSKAA